MEFKGKDINDNFIIKMKECGFYDDLLEIITKDGLIDISVDDIKGFENDEIIGFISTSFNDINTNININLLANEKPNRCLLNISGKSSLRLDEIDKIISKVKNKYDDIDITFGAIMDDNLKTNFKVQALLTFKPSIENNETEKPIEHINVEIKNETDLIYAVALFVSKNRASINLVQHEFTIGFNRTSIIFDKLENLGILSSKAIGKPRDVLIKDEDTLKHLIYGA